MSRNPYYIPTITASESVPVIIMTPARLEQLADTGRYTSARIERNKHQFDQDANCISCGTYKGSSMECPYCGH